MYASLTVSHTVSVSGVSGCVFLAEQAERSPQESSVSSDSRIASIFFMLSSYDSFLLWSSPRNGLFVWIDYEVVCDFLFMVNYRLFRPFLSASLESSFLTASICGSNSARSAKII